MKQTQSLFPLSIMSLVEEAQMAQARLSESLNQSVTEIRVLEVLFEEEKRAQDQAKLRLYGNPKLYEAYSQYAAALQEQRDTVMLKAKQKMLTGMDKAAAKEKARLEPAKGPKDVQPKKEEEEED